MDQLIASARARISNTLGQKLAAKATDAFCLVHGQPQVAYEPLSQTPSSVVLEFADQSHVSAAIVDAVEGIRKSPAWDNVRQLLKQTQVSTKTSGAVTEVMERGGSEPDLLAPHAARLLRYLKVVSLRDNFHKISAPITQTIESSPLRSAFAVAETLAGERGPSPITQVCWLNRTVRSWGDPRSLAEVAADDSIERIDLPHRVEPEINISGGTVGAPGFREQFMRSGKDIIVAVIDGEVAVAHPALKGRVVLKENFTVEPWGHPSPHGTAVAGIIASNDVTFSGMAPQATIYSYKILATNRLLNGTDFDGALGIQHALEDGAHIANCSWGAGPATDGTSREAKACDTAWAAGLVIVKSAGNRGPGVQTVTTPADANGVVVVGATDREGTAVQNYSSRGPAGAKQRPHLIAPGGSPMTGIMSCLPGGGFGDCGAGTSFAAPHVAGMLALLLERDPSLTPDQLRNMLVNASVSLDGIEVNTQGQGLVSLVRIP